MALRAPADDRTLSVSCSAARVGGPVESVNPGGVSFVIANRSISDHNCTSLGHRERAVTNWSEFDTHPNSSWIVRSDAS
jgi:hypothetical protein